MNRHESNPPAWNEIPPLHFQGEEEASFITTQTSAMNGASVCAQAEPTGANCFAAALAGRFHFDEEAERWDGLS